jgi:hypothetical protein
MTSSLVQTATLVAIRAAHHPETTPKYDRVVFEFDGPIPLFEIEYVEQLLGDGSGLPVPIAGRSILQVVFRDAQAHNDSGQVTAPVRLTPKLPIVREVINAGDFEGVVTYGIGVSRKAELRILTLADKSRVVIDFILQGQRGERAVHGKH